MTASPAERWIGVLADDFTGAAELAGTAHARGLRAAVFTSFGPDTQTDGLDVVAIDGDTRSADPHTARQRTTDHAADIAARRPAWAYKKCDSVLRGHVALEALAMQRAVGCRAVQFCSANPTRGRVVRDGQYFVNGVPLHQTSFADDPEYPRQTNDVHELLGRPAADTFFCHDAESREALEQLAQSTPPERLPAGAVEFFEALLDHRRGTRPPAATARADEDMSPIAGRTLFVCGSAAGWRAGRRTAFERLGWPIAALPAGDPHDVGLIRHWSRQIGAALLTGETAVAAIGRDDALPGVTPTYLARALASAVAWALSDDTAPVVARLCVEGGSTAAEVSRAMSWNRLDVVRNWTTGVVELRPTKNRLPSVVAKVGSYDWPAALLPPAGRGVS